MNLDELIEKLNDDGYTRTSFFSELTTNLRAKKIIGDFDGIEISPAEDGTIGGFVIKPGSKDPVLQLDGANTTIDLLKKYGVDDFKLIKPIDPKLDPYMWNVVYKNGGWVINS